MKVRLGTLRAFLREAALLEQAWVPGRWDPRHGEPVDGEDLAAMGETDDRMVGDGAEDDLAVHLRDKDDGLTLGDPVAENVNAEIRRYMMQEQEEVQQPIDKDSSVGDDNAPDESGSTESDSAAPTGFYTPFDMERDHSATWYRSPGQAMGTAGDPFRSEDAATQLGMHPSPNGTTPPGTSGEPTQLAPQIWQLSAGSDTSKVLGANAKPDSGGVDSGDGSKESEAPGGDAEGEDSGEAGTGDESEGDESQRARPGNRQNR